ncbi:MAG: hypothetical protein JKY95_04735 [Planctomycetaceae bacterium]|nr:hypothetical protein [Planctomycetaceae bacterium]
MRFLFAEKTRRAIFSFCHAADLHIDSPFCGIVSKEAVVAEAFYASTFLAFESLGNLALNEKAIFCYLLGHLRWQGPKCTCPSLLSRRLGKTVQISQDIDPNIPIYRIADGTIQLERSSMKNICIPNDL